MVNWDQSEKVRILRLFKKIMENWVNCCYIFLKKVKRKVKLNLFENGKYKGIKGGGGMSLIIMLYRNGNKKQKCGIGGKSKSQFLKN